MSDANTPQGEEHTSPLPSPPSTGGQLPPSSYYNTPAYRSQTQWLEAERRAGTTPESLYQRMASSGKSVKASRDVAAQLLPENSRHPIVTLLAYFSLGLAGLFFASGAHTALDLANEKECVPAEYVGKPFDPNMKAERGSGEYGGSSKSGEWVFVSEGSDWLGLNSLGEWTGLLLTGSSGSSDAPFDRGSLFMGKESCEEALSESDLSSRQNLARWLSLTLLMAPIAFFTLRNLAAIDRRDKYARLFPYRFTLNTVLLSLAAGIGGIKLLTYLTGLISVLVGASEAANMLVDFGHLVITLSVAGGLLIFSTIQYRRWRDGWGATQGDGGAEDKQEEDKQDVDKQEDDAAEKD